MKYFILPIAAFVISFALAFLGGLIQILHWYGAELFFLGSMISMLGTIVLLIRSVITFSRRKE